MPNSAEDMVERTLAPLAAIEIPPALTLTIARHQQNLLELAKALLAGGIPKPTVEASLETMFASYKYELVNVIAALQEARNVDRI